MAGLRIARESRIEIAPRDEDWARTIWFGLVSGYLLLALIAGGTARYGASPATFLELLSLPVVLIAAVWITSGPLTGMVKAGLLICAGFLAVPLLQLIPLPPVIWTSLPGRGFVVDAFEAAKIPLSWLPLSLSPPATLRSFLSLFPALAIFLATLTLGHRARRRMTLGLIGFGLVCVPYGLAQVASGPASGLRLYEVTNVNSAVGFFANRNHFAALLYSIVPFIAVWMIHQARSRDSGRVGWIVLMIVVYGVLILGLGMSASRTGIALAMAAIFASVLLAWWQRRPSRRNPASRAVFIAALIGSCVVLQFGLVSILDRLQHDPLEDGRFTFAQVTLRAAASVFPFGSGLGSFVPFYAMFETPSDISHNYVNHAHNDWLELALETGLPGLTLALLFLAWFAIATYRIWRQSDADIDSLLAQAATVAVTLLLAHSLVDYPLRTTALACLFGFACALCVPPLNQIQAGTDFLSQRKMKTGVRLHKDRRTSRSVAKSPQFRLKAIMEESAASSFSMKDDAGSLGRRRG